MSADRDVTRIVRSWLHEDAHEDADRVLTIVLEEIDTTPQRRSLFSARRTAQMNNTVRLVAAAAAVVVVLIGYQFLIAPNVGGPGPSPSQTETPTVEPTPSPAPSSAAAFPPAGPLAVGRHSMTLAGVPLWLELSTDWVSNGVFRIDKVNLNPGDPAAFVFWPDSAPDNVFSDPCSPAPLDPPAGLSAAERAAAVATIPGTELVDGPKEVTVGGYPAQHVVIHIPVDNVVNCGSSEFHLWYDADDASGQPGRYAPGGTTTIRVWIIDVDGTIVWIEGETYDTSFQETEQEVEEIVNSIQFE